LAENIALFFIFKELTMTNVQQQKSRVALLSIASNTLLVVGKIVAGLLIGSVSVLSEAIHSGLDLLAALIAYFAVQTSSKPADAKHPFGHGKIENLSGTIEALLIFLAAGWIIYEAVHKLIKPVPLADVGLGIGIMFLSAIMNIIVSERLFRVGRATESMALQADAWHLRTDVWTSLGVMGALVVIWFSEKLFPGHHFHWLDPLAALGVALLIFKAAYNLTIQSGRDLLDESLTESEEKAIREIILKHRVSICGFHRLKTRKSGSHRFVEFHLLVDPTMTVAASHQLTADISEEIETHYSGSTVTIHIEPCDGSCPDYCVEGCLLEKDQREKIHTNKSQHIHPKHTD
jgi:cation diffusion facilitator family transporter